VSGGLRSHPGDRLVRQLARCAREYGCRGAANAFAGTGECALPIAAPSNERPPAAVAPHRDGEAEPTEPAAFHPSTDELAGLAREHFASGGTMVGFGRACEGEPLLAAREVEDAIARIRIGTRDGTIHLSTNGSVPSSLRRLRSAGLDSMTVRLISARAATYEALHGPDYRFSEVRASLRLGAELRVSLSVLVPVLPGIFDRPDELTELVALLSELPAGSTLLVRDLHADPLRALARVYTRGVEPLGIAVALKRIAEQAGHVRVGSFVRPSARVGVPNVP
jgi:pyruvate-formate lyase-activating enzyme